LREGKGRLDLGRMKELKELLEKCIEADEGTVVSFDCHIPQVTIRLHDSRTMLQYGIQRKKEIGFSVGIAIDKGSKKGKQIIYEFNNKKSLDSFKEFEEDRWKLYVKDSVSL
jgi:hypothetical protein